MSNEKDMSERFLMGQSSLQSGDEAPQVFDVYQLPPVLPTNLTKREICFDHIRSGVALELMGDFDLFGVRFPERDEPQEITTQLSCKGVGCILKKCGLKVEQFASDGTRISEMKTSA